MAGPSKRLGKGKNRLKFEDVSPKAEKEEQEMLDKKAGGGSLKAVPEGNAGLAKLPTDVRNKMGYMKRGGSVKKMGMGGKCRGMGAATRGGNFVRNG
jgi:hypothetical protein